MRLQSRDGLIFEVEPSAMHLSLLIQDVLECCDAPEEELVPLPSVSGAMLAKVIDFCKAHGGVAPEAPPKPLPSADLAECGLSRHACELLDLPAEGVFELLRAAEYLNMEPLTNLTLAKLASLMASLMIVEPPREPKDAHQNLKYAASLFARVRKHSGKLPWGWRRRLWDAEQSAYVDGCSEGGTPFYVHDETGFCSVEVPGETSWGDGFCGPWETWSELAADKLWSERGPCRRSRRDRLLVPRALHELRASAQQWEDALSGGAHVELPELLLQTLGPCFDPSFQGKITDLPRPLQRQIEHYLRAEMVTLLSDARALVECLGLDTLAEGLGAQLGNALDAWQAELQKLKHLMPRAMVNRTSEFAKAESLELRADGTFIQTFFVEYTVFDDYNSSSTWRASQVIGTWSIHRGPACVEYPPRLGLLVEGSVILEGTARVVDIASLELEAAGARVEAVRQVISCGELLKWSEEAHAWAEFDVVSAGHVWFYRAHAIYPPTFAGALESCFRCPWLLEIPPRCAELLEDLRRFFRDAGAGCRSAAAISCGAEPPAREAPPEEGTVTDTVEMEVLHDEEPAAIDPLEAEEASSQLWATAVERMNNGAIVPEEPSVDVAVMHFNKDPGAFDRVLLDSPLAHRAAQAGIQAQPSWANGAKVFVKEVGPELLEEAHVELKPRHVVVYLDDVQEVLDAVAALPSTSRPRLKRTSPLVVVPGVDSASLFGDTTASSSSQSGQAPRYQVTESDGSAAASGGSVSTAAMPLVVRMEVRNTFLHFYEEADEADEEVDEEAPPTARSA